MRSIEERLMQEWDFGDFQNMLDKMWEKVITKHPLKYHIISFATMLEKRLENEYFLKRNQNYSVGLWTTDDGQHIVVDFTFDFDLNNHSYKYMTGSRNLSHVEDRWFNNGRGISVT